MDNEQQPIDEQKELLNTVGTIGWRIIVERIQEKVRRKTDANDVDVTQPGDQVKADLIGRQKAREIIDEVIREVIGEASYIKKKRTDYS
jgi:hypothetical protein